MKKQIHLASLFIILSIVIYSCKKNDIDDNSDNNAKIEIKHLQ